MAASTGPIAKISIPKLFGVVARPRLFERLDENRGRPLVWIDSPPGSGKTSLIASYLEARALPTLWYQVDGGDADPGAVFDTLATAAQGLFQVAQRQMPRFLAEHATDVPAFARTFFRELFARLPREAILVFDNFQDGPAEGSLHEIVHEAVASLLPGQSVCCISREDAPRGFAGLKARGAMVTLHWDDLRLTLEEATCLIHAESPCDDELVQALYRQSEGWAAGITLMLERLRQTGAGAGELLPESREWVFEYFAELCFDQLPVPQQQSLVMVSFLPYVNAAIAALLEPEVDPCVLMESLHRRRMFVDKRPGSTPVYVFHALFREFLQRRGKRMWEAASVREAILSGARALSEAHDVPAAIDILVDEEHWGEAIELILGMAAILVRGGRRLTLQRWIERLPTRLVETRPLLLYWLGVTRAKMIPVDGIPTLERALALYRDQDDVQGQLLCLTALLKFGFIGYSALNSMDGWLESLLGTLDAMDTLPLTIEQELALYGVLSNALMMYRPMHPMADVLAQETIDLLRRCDDPDVSIEAAIGAMHLEFIAGRFDTADRLADAIVPLIDSAMSGPCEMIWAFIHLGYLRFYQARYESALEHFSKACDLADQDGLRSMSALALMLRCMVEFRVCGWRAANATLREVERLQLPDTPGIRALLLIFQARRAEANGRLYEASMLAEASYRINEQTGAIHRRLVWRLFCGEVLVAAGRSAVAREWFDMSKSILARSGIYKSHVANLLLCEAFATRQEGDLAAALVQLREALQVAQIGTNRYFLRFQETSMPPMFNLAIEQGIEVDFVQSLIRLFRLRPREGAADLWPWPVRIRTLGRFEVRVDDVPLDFPRKTPRKTLLLLKALIAHGAREVPEQWLCDALWGDDEGDAAREALGITVLRLRKLLGSCEAVLQQGGRVTLNRAWVWVDVWRFEAAAQEGRKQGARRALEYYRGTLLPEDEGESWTVRARERLRGRFIHLLATLGQEMESSGIFEDAVDLYLRGIDADPVVEIFHQGLMRCYQRAGRHLETISAYRRFRQTLSAILGVQPSSATVALYEASRNACRGQAGQDGGVGEMDRVAADERRLRT